MNKTYLLIYFPCRTAHVTKIPKVPCIYFHNTHVSTHFVQSEDYFTFILNTPLTAFITFQHRAIRVSAPLQTHTTRATLRTFAFCTTTPRIFLVRFISTVCHRIFRDASHYGFSPPLLLFPMLELVPFCS